jgi:hypothetical protein
LTANNLVAITNTISVSVLNGYAAVAITNFAVAIGVDTRASISSGRIVVTSGCVLTADDFVAITYAISVCVLNRYTAVAIAYFTVAISVNTRASVSC